MTKIERIRGVEIVSVDHDRRDINYLKPDGVVLWIHDASTEMLRAAEQALGSNQTVTLVIKEEGGLGRVFRHQLIDFPIDCQHMSIVTIDA